MNSDQAIDILATAGMEAQRAGVYTLETAEIIIAAIRTLRPDLLKPYPFEKAPSQELPKSGEQTAPIEENAG